MIVVIDIAGCFLSPSLATSVKPKLLYHLRRCHKKRVTTLALIYILRELI